ncbi:hypothetical protein EsDP_00007524 [Epichloe bromicola]|uniref:Uncharacterized protein n=1 Tax=Epichloe bromicola TaxID=79588 RepID=A0ABQ0D0U3_9HYPO
MRISIIAIASLCASAAAFPEFNKRTETPSNTTSVMATSATMPHGTGLETSSPSSTGIFNNGTSTSSEASSATTSSTHKTTASPISSTSSSTAGAAPTGIWANEYAKGAVAGAVGIMGLALAL